MLRGIRGATTTHNTVEDMRETTIELLEEMVDANGLASDELAAAIFCLTPDLNAMFPTAAAREGMGWDQVPLLDHVAPSVPGSLGGCIRVLLLWNTPKAPTAIHHVYLRGARRLRPDLLEVKQR